MLIRRHAAMNLHQSVQGVALGDRSGEHGRVVCGGSRHRRDANSDCHDPASGRRHAFEQRQNHESYNDGAQDADHEPSDLQGSAAGDEPRPGGVCCDTLRQFRDTNPSSQ